MISIVREYLPQGLFTKTFVVYREGALARDKRIRESIYVSSAELVLSSKYTRKLGHI